MPALETEEQVEQTDTGSLLSRTAEQYAPHNKYVAELTPEVVTERLKSTISVVRAISKLEQMEPPVDEEARKTRQTILNAAKLFYQDNFVSTDKRSYVKETTPNKPEDLREITISIDEKKRQEELARVEDLLESDDFKRKLAHARQVRENIGKLRGSGVKTEKESQAEMDISKEDREALLQDTYGVLAKLGNAQTLLNRSDLDRDTTEAYQLVIAAAYNAATGTQLLNPDIQQTGPVIEIDEKQRQKEVDELTSTDFFTNLKSRANEMRQRHHVTQTPTPLYGNTETRTDTITELGS